MNIYILENGFKMARTQITIYPDEILKSLLDNEAEKENRSLSNLILNILASHYKLQRTQRRKTSSRSINR